MNGVQNSETSRPRHTVNCEHALQWDCKDSSLISIEKPQSNNTGNQRWNSTKDMFVSTNATRNTKPTRLNEWERRKTRGRKLLDKLSPSINQPTKSASSHHIQTSMQALLTFQVHGNNTIMSFVFTLFACSWWCRQSIRWDTEHENNPHKRRRCVGGNVTE